MGKSAFYLSNNLEKYPDGVLSQCKKCITMHVDNWEPQTYLWILQEADVPYIPDEWNRLMLRYAKDKSKVTGLTIIGRYLAKMRLKQYSDYRWRDNEFLQEIHDKQIKESMSRQGYSQVDIDQVIQKSTVDIPEGQLMPPESSFENEDEDEIFSPIIDEKDINLDLTDEDKLYLKLKWGKLYKPFEWVQLEQLYNDMMDSYDIQEAGHIDTLKLICKTSLKANQLVDIGD